MNNEKIENQVFDLLEEKEFDQLSTKEQAMVLQLMTEEDYALQRRIMSAGNEERDREVPGPLVLPAEKRKIIPIWVASACSAAAAAILVFLMMPPSDSLEIELKSITVPAMKDTLIVENTVTDTVIDYRYITVTKNTCPDIPSNEDLVQIPDYPRGGAFIPARQNDLVNKGISAANDADIELFKAGPFIGM